MLATTRSAWKRSFGAIFSSKRRNGAYYCDLAGRREIADRFPGNARFRANAPTGASRERAFADLANRASHRYSTVRGRTPSPGSRSGPGAFRSGRPSHRRAPNSYVKRFPKLRRGMPKRNAPRKASQKSVQGFTEEERAAMRQTVKERGRARTGKVDGEQDVLAKIAEMDPSDRLMAERLHDIIKAKAPGLSPKTWYGMPAHAKDDQVLCFFRPAQKFKTRYATLGFSDESKHDEGHMWATEFALTELAATEEARIVALLKRAVR